MTVTGLARFVRSAREAAMAARAEQPPRCELCGSLVGEDHGHVVDIDSRSIRCSCRPCYLLFTPDGSVQRFRAVPQRFRYTPRFRLADATWDDIGIPVRMAFFFANSGLGQTVACYPSPAGATESQLDLQAWRQVLAANPAMADLRDDVEALLVNRADGGFECYLVPIDACYQLVGLVKLHWRGFDGGEEAWAAIDGFFAELRDRSEVVDG